MQHLSRKSPETVEDECLCHPGLRTGRGTTPVIALARDRFGGRS